ncbi:MAG: uroporphyrinogen-III synthase [Methylococcales bacterium]
MTGLNGARILVTRPAHQADNLSRLIEQRGGIAVRFPTLAIVESADLVAIQKTLANLDEFQWLIFVSSNAVNFALKANGGKIAQPKKLRLGAIGKATANALAMAGLSIDLIPEQDYNSEALLALPDMQNIREQRVLIVRGEGGREELANTLRSRGADVHYLNVYKRSVPSINNTEVISLLEQQKLDIITATSGEALQNLLIMLDAAHHRQLFTLPLVVVSDRIKQLAAELGFKRIAVASSPSDEAILETVNQNNRGIAWPN